MEETRTLTFEDAQIRAKGSGSRQRFTFEGYAHTFGTTSEPLREAGVNRGQPFRERVIGPEAVRDTLATDDIRFVLNHDLGALLGRTKSGTLELGADTRGLNVRSELPNTSYANDYAELVQRGDAGEMSFRFYGEKDTFTFEAGEAIRTLHSFRIREVSALTVPPAYANTSATISLEEARMLAFAEEEIRAGRVLSQENLDALEDLVARIRAIIEKAEGPAEDGPEDKPDPNDAARSAPIPILRRRLELAERLL